MAQNWCPKCRRLVRPEVLGVSEWCPICGSETRTPRASEMGKPSPKPVSRQLASADYEQNLDLAWKHADIGRFMVRLTERMYNTMGAELPAHATTVFRNRQVSCCHWAKSKGGRPQLIYGYEDVERSVTKGYQEYPSIWHSCWGDTKLVTGLEAAYRIVVHEFAHIIQVSRDEVSYGSVHNGAFIQALLAVRNRFPFDMIKGL